jgi:hypothetical protein
MIPYKLPLLTPLVSMFLLLTDAERTGFVPAVAIPRLTFLIRSGKNSAKRRHISVRIPVNLVPVGHFYSYVTDYGVCKYYKSTKES